MSVQVYDDYWQKIQELFAKERQWMTTQMQGHIREVNYMFADETKSVNVTRNMMVAISVTMSSVFWFFFTISIFVVAGGVGMMVVQCCVK